MSEAGLTHSFPHHSFLALQNTRQNFSTTLWGHFQWRNHQLKAQKNVKRMALSRFWKGHSFTNTRAETRRLRRKQPLKDQGEAPTEKKQIAKPFRLLPREAGQHWGTDHSHGGQTAVMGRRGPKNAPKVGRSGHLGSPAFRAFPSIMVPAAWHNSRYEKISQVLLRPRQERSKVQKPSEGRTVSVITGRKMNS